VLGFDGEVIVLGNRIGRRYWAYWGERLGDKMRDGGIDGGFI